MGDSKKRSWMKSIVWRTIGIIIMPPIIWLVGTLIDNSIASIVLWTTVIFHSIRMIMYYIHERIWEKISWGRK
ncbi:MAG: DUF2061 domain-containing protein [Candidatus Aenigmarchaeota archaeon]|nr:DUF2061 domain-containing protein [Candidatus Aenigmarchaeota archaeon]